MEGFSNSVEQQIRIVCIDLCEVLAVLDNVPWRNVKWPEGNRELEEAIKVDGSRIRSFNQPVGQH